MVIEYTYEQAHHVIKPLALALFAGKEFVSDVIRWTQSRSNLNTDVKTEDIKRVFSHVGVIVDKDCMPMIKNTYPGRHYVIESTASGKLVSEVVDCESAQGVLGVQVRDFEWVCATYNGVIAVANLADNPFEAIDGETVEEYHARLAVLRRGLALFHKETYHRMYQLNVLRLISAMFPAFRGLRVCFPISKKWIFCSELVAMLYAAAGVIGPDTKAKNVVPMDFVDPSEDLFEPVFYIQTLVLHKEHFKRKRDRAMREQKYVKKYGRMPEGTPTSEEDSLSEGSAIEGMRSPVRASQSTHFETSDLRKPVRTRSGRPELHKRFNRSSFSNADNSSGALGASSVIHQAL